MAEIARRFKAAFGGLLDPLRSVLRPRFTFREDADKLDAFQSWFREQVRQNILIVEDPLRETPWLATYVRSAYREAIVRAHALVRRGQKVPHSDLTGEEFLIQAFAAPERVSKIRMMASRVFTDLKGVTQDMDTKMTRILTDAIAHGTGLPKVARSLSGEVGIGRRRAQVIARTEIIRVHAEGQLDAFEELGIKSVDLEVELLTAWNACPICKNLASKGPFTLRKARGLIPVHPRCRCCWRPLIPSSLLSKSRL